MKQEIDKSNIPAHIAIIMDGNGRWAKKNGSMRVKGHQHGVKSVREVTEAAGELGVKYLTMYAFSTENWSRPEYEVTALMHLLVSTIRKEARNLNKNNIKLMAIGNVESLPSVCQKELNEAIKLTKDNTGLNLVLALSYSGRWEIVNASKKIAEDVKAGKIDADKIDDNLFASYLQTGVKGIPDPELMIRTSGEMRISNYLLWQIAYSELYITDTLWPDFNKEEFNKAILSYQQRERRFGKTSEQLSKVN
ncbi:MAG: isoprenyl transferase [Thalassobius sp.]|nr:isoprenyl transferase [Thalassovita sp.]